MFYGQFDPPMDRVLWEVAFAGSQQPGIFLESGALDGRQNSNCLFFEESLGWKGVNVEPVPHLFSRLQRHRPKALNLPFALSDRYGFQEISFPTHPVHGDNFGNASLQHTATHRAGLERSGCTFTDFMVPTVPFGHLAHFFDISAIDLFSLDVEGHELPVLQSMFEVGVRPRVLCVEIDHANPQAIRGMLQAQGYLFLGEHFANLIAKRQDNP